MRAGLLLTAFLAVPAAGRTIARVPAFNALPGLPSLNPLPALPMHAILGALPALPNIPLTPALSLPAVEPSVKMLPTFQEKLHSVEKAVQQGKTATASSQLSDLFDGGGFAPGTVDVGSEWAGGGFASHADGAEIRYRERAPSGPEKAAPKVFVGGMGLAESFATYHETGRDEHSREYVLSLRGLPPTPWSGTRHTFDSDARDLARMILIAARKSPTGNVDMVLHSYSALVFQRMLQLGSDPGVAMALSALKGAHLTFLGTTTHYGDSETVAGPEFAQMAKVVRAFINWLDLMDDYARGVDQWGALNPMFRFQADAWLAGWKAQRDAAVRMASDQAVEMLTGHLAEPWDPKIDRIRRRLLEDLRAASREPGWREALLRRANDTSLLEFTPKDVARLTQLGVTLDIVYGDKDQLVPWSSERVLLDLLGIDSPESIPPAGTVLQSPSGLLRVFIVAGDHYLPLKQPDRLREFLR